MADRTYELAELETEKTYLLRLFKLYDLKRECCIPAIVEEYNRGTHTATVRPLVNHWKRNADKLEDFARMEVTVGVLQFAHGGFIVDAPLFRGDTGWLIAGDRAALEAMGANSSFLYKDQREDLKWEDEKNKGAASPDNSDSAHFVHGFFVPCSWAKTGLAQGDGLVVHHATGLEKNGKVVDVEVGVRDVRMTDGGIEASLKPVAGEDAGLTVSLTEEEASVKRVGADGKHDEVRVCADGLKFDGVVDREQSVVTDFRYDVGTHQLQKKTVTHKVRGDFVVGVSEETDWAKIDGGQAVEEDSSGGGCECAFQAGSDTNIVFNKKDNIVVVDVYYK